MELGDREQFDHIRRRIAASFVGALRVGVRSGALAGDLDVASVRGVWVLSGRYVFRYSKSLGIYFLYLVTNRVKLQDLVMV